MIPAWVGDYLAIPFADHGRDRSGCDCYGLVRLVLAERFGVTGLPDLTEAYRKTDQRESIARLIDVSRPLLDFARVDTPQPGDVVLVRQFGYHCHLGIVVAENMMLHTEAGTGPAVVDFTRPHLAPRIEGFYRHG